MFPTLPISFRFKLALWTWCIFALLLVGVGAVGHVIQAASIRSYYRERIEQRGADILAKMRQWASPVDGALLTEITEKHSMAVMERVSALVVDAEGRILTQSNGAPAGLAAAAQQLGGLATSKETAAYVDENLFQRPDGAGTRLAVLPFEAADGRSLYLVVGISDVLPQRLLGVARQTATLSAFVALAAGAIAVWIVSGYAVRPLTSLKRIMGALRPETLKEPLRMDGGPEIQALTLELERARRALDSHMALQERFISHVSHELRTPIATLLVEAQTLAMSEGTQESREFAQSVEDEMRRLGQMVDSLLILARVRMGRERFRKPCSLADAATDAVRQVEREAEKRRVTLRLELSEPDGIVIVGGDTGMLRTLAASLLRYAITASKPGDTITTSVLRDGDEALLVVRDEGLRIEEQRIARLFDRESDCDEPGDRSGGLLLHIAQAIAEAHSGNISARNHVGGGCEFTVRLPSTVAAGSESHG